jgi:hypothetical protein
VNAYSDDRATQKKRGRPPSCPLQVRIRVIDLWRQGLSLDMISRTLNREGISTPTGRSRWTKSHVDRLLHTKHVQELIRGALAKI